MDDILTIRTEKTPNPNSLKYNVGRILVPGGSANFPTASSAELRSPLAKRMFAVPGVTGVFLGSDFFTISRQEGIAWATINDELAPALEAFFESGEPVLTGRDMSEKHTIGNPDENPELTAKIQKLLEENVRPAVMQDGGDIIFRGYEKGVVYLEMYGACSSCPSSTATLKVGVETMLREALPGDVLEVQAI
jgi:Fe-S cluster biogenesis protein NfuA